MVDNNTKFVEFGKYCKQCKHLNTRVNEGPCNECLETPARSGTEVPIKFEKKNKN